MQEYKVTVDDKGTIRWYKFGTGKLHRTDGPACEYANGTKFWYVDDKRHRLDGPACEYADGSKYWYVDDKLHRTDGPAIECVDGTKAWWVDGRNYSEKQFNKKVKELQQSSCDGKVVEIDGKKYKLTEV